MLSNSISSAKANEIKDFEMINNDSSSTINFFADFADLDEIKALEDGDLSLLANPNKFRMLTETLHISPDEINLTANKREVLQSHQSNKKYEVQTHNNYGDDLLVYSPTTDASSVCSETLPPYASKILKINFMALSNDNNNSNQCQNNNLLAQEHEKQQNLCDLQQMPPPPTLPPIVISPADIDNISIQLEKNQQCACKDCGKLFNSVWYLKQHAVKHSNDRPFKCKFCLKTYKFRSNLYQHKCPERNRHFGGIGQSFRKRLYTRGIAYTEMYNKALAKNEENFEFQNHSRLSPLISTPISAVLLNTNHLVATLDSLQSGYTANTQKSDLTQNKLENNYLNQKLNENNMFKSTINSSHDVINQYSIDQQINTSDTNSQNNQNKNEFFQSVNKIDLPENVQNFQNEFMFQQQQNSQYMVSRMNYGNCLECYSDFMSGTDMMGHSCCIRKKPLNQEYIDSYIQKNKNRVYSCRKCKLSFPNREYLDRHMAYHNTMELEPFVCEQCPQRFSTYKQLQNHFLQHSDNSPHKCIQCCGVFRSALALRRHKDQCRQCYCPPFGIYPKLMISPSAPLDPYGFIESEDEIDMHSKFSKNQQLTFNNKKNFPMPYCGTSTINAENGEQIFCVENIETNIRKQTVDSGIGSDCSAQSFNISPSSVETFDDDSRFNQNAQTQRLQQEYLFYKYSNNNNNKTQLSDGNLEYLNKISNKKHVVKSTKGIEEEETEEEEEEDDDEDSDKEDNKYNENNEKKSNNNNYYNYDIQSNKEDHMSQFFTKSVNTGYRTRLNSALMSQNYSSHGISSSSASSITHINNKSPNQQKSYFETPNRAFKNSKIYETPNEDLLNENFETQFNFYEFEDNSGIIAYRPIKFYWPVLKAKTFMLEEQPFATEIENLILRESYIKQFLAAVFLKMAWYIINLKNTDNEYQLDVGPEYAITLPKLIPARIVERTTNDQLILFVFRVLHKLAKKIYFVFLANYIVEFLDLVLSINAMVLTNENWQINDIAVQWQEKK